MTDGGLRDRSTPHHVDCPTTWDLVLGTSGRKVDMSTPLYDFSGLHEPYGPQVVWVQLDSLAGCIIDSNRRDLGHDLA